MLQHTMLSMKDVVETLETQITTFCKKQQFPVKKQQQICDMALEAITLNHQNYYLRKAIDDHRFFHSMAQLEYEHVCCCCCLCGAYMMCLPYHCPIDCI